MILYVTHPAVRRAANSLFGPGAFVNDSTISEFEQAYCCQIERVKGKYGITPKLTFNTEKDFTFFVLKWS